MTALYQWLRRRLPEWIEASFMRIALVLVVLLLSGCAGAYHTSSDGRLQTRIDDGRTRRAMPACAKNADADGTMSLDAGLGRASRGAGLHRRDRQADRGLQSRRRSGGRQPHSPGLRVPGHGLRAEGPRPRLDD